MIVTPAPPGSRRGNRVTAERWLDIFLTLGCDAAVRCEYAGEPADLLVALHAGREADAVARFRGEHPEGHVVVAVTGTDIYGNEFDRQIVERTLASADRIIVLQPKTAEDLAAALRGKVRVIYQSAMPPVTRQQPRGDLFEVAVVGHLRPVKDPFRTAAAAALLGEDSRVRVVHLGEALSDDMAEQARRESQSNPRYQWLGDLPHEDALAVMSRCRLVVLTSLSEGGPAVIPEAIVAGVPVLATRVSGCVGMLGEDYPGLVDPGDTPALADLLSRCEREPAFYQSLRDACDRRRPLFSPAAEEAAWGSLLAELGLRPRAT